MRLLVVTVSLQQYTESITEITDKCIGLHEHIGTLEASSAGATVKDEYMSFRHLSPGTLGHRRESSGVGEHCKNTCTIRRDVGSAYDHQLSLVLTGNRLEMKAE